MNQDLVKEVVLYGWMRLTAVKVIQSSKNVALEAGDPITVTIMKMQVSFVGEVGR